MVNKVIIMQIYKITNLINNKIYIGKDTTSDPNYFGSGLIINRAFEKYGIENFIKEVIDETDDYIELSNKEIYWIDQYNSTDRKVGYNISKGGDGGDTLSNHPDLDLIREKISKNSPKKGKTYEEAFGEEKAKEYKLNLSKSNKRHALGKTYEELYGDEKTNELKKIISINSKKSWTEDRKNQHSNLAKKNIYNSLLSENGIKKNKEYLNNRWHKWRESEKIFIEYLIKSSNIIELIKYFDKIPNTLFKNRKQFYDFIGIELHKLLKKHLNKRRKSNSNNESNKREIIIDNTQYESISEASKNLNLDRSLIRSRLKSSHFKNYLFKDNELNIKYNKFIEVDPHLSKKERISIDGEIYESITEASKILNKEHDYISWRLNSKSYTDWVYLDKIVELKETGVPKMKRVSILGKEYESISKAVDGSGIDRQIIRYRLKSKNYPDYFYI
jgi:hypothetical protein